MSDLKNHIAAELGRQHEYFVNQAAILAPQVQELTQQAQEDVNIASREYAEYLFAVQEHYMRVIDEVPEEERLRTFQNDGGYNTYEKGSEDAARAAGNGRRSELALTVIFKREAEEKVASALKALKETSTVVNATKIKRELAIFELRIAEAYVCQTGEINWNACSITRKRDDDAIPTELEAVMLQATAVSQEVGAGLGVGGNANG